MDAVDRAQEREAELRDDALAARRQTLELPKLTAGVRVCLDCDDPISAKRLKANPQAVRCMDCQQEHEHQQMRARGCS